MGANLYFKLNDITQAEDAANFLNNHTPNKILDEHGIVIIEPFAIEEARKENSHWLSYLEKNLGKGDIKTSGVDESGIYSASEILEEQTKVFEILNEKFGMKYYANSCSFTNEEDYFSLEQMKRITNNGEYLSGRSTKKYAWLYPLLNDSSNDTFDISKIKEKDKLLINGKWRNVVKTYGNKLQVQTGDYEHTKELLKDVKDLIEQHEKYVPAIQYNGAVAYIESYIMDNGILIYLELSGQESMVKSITSVLMQGRTKMNDKTVNADTLGYFQINKQGNKRKLTSLGDGIAHSILYHAPSIASTDFNVLIGRDEQELSVSFEAWLEKSQPMPYPKELANNIFKEMQERDLLQSISVFNVEALKIDEKIKNENYEVLQDIIIAICRDNGLIDPNAVPMKIDAPLPKSPVLSEEQVQKIFNTLKNMPKTYELEDISVKPIGLKLFGPSFTYYIVEADKGSEEDEFINEHTQCYGYIKNESDPQSSEWGYINVQEILSNGSSSNYYEQDLYFDDMFIDSSGNIGKKEDLSSNTNDTEIMCPLCNEKSVVIVESSEYSLCACTKCGHNHKVYSKEAA